MKMWSKIIFFVATLCVVNASVININVFDDQSDALLGDGVEDCNWRACDQLCRRLGFPSGTCINGRCKCDNFKSAEDELQRLVDSEDDYSLQSCNNQECDQRCRRLKFHGGVCVNGRCKCDNFRGAEAFAAVIEDYLALRSCNPQECYQRCRRLKFPSGTCINGRCKCDNFRSANDSVLNSQATVSVGCDYRVCNERCQQLGFAGGVCVNNHCICKNGKHVKGIVIHTTDSTSDASDYRQVRNCNPQTCNTLCRFLRFKSGTCVNGNCQCSRNEEANTETNEIEEGGLIQNEDESVEGHHDRVARATCYQYSCNDRCLRVGYVGGQCKKNKYLNTDFKKYKSAEACNMFACNERCKTLGFRGGICIENICKCHNLP